MRALGLAASAVLLAGVVIALAMASGRLDLPRDGVVVTLLPYHALAAALLADTEVTPSLLIPPGESPHTFVARPSDVERAARARVLVADGVHDRALLELAGTSGSGPRLVAIALEPEVHAALPTGFAATLATDGHDHGHDHDHAHDHDHGAFPPEWIDRYGHEPAHIWLDPLALSAASTVMARELARSFPSSASTIQANATRIASELDALHRTCRARTAPLAGRPFVLFHGAFSIFSARYGLAQASVVQRSAGLSPTPREVAELSASCRARGVMVIFTEPQLADRSAQVLAAELGLPLALIDPLGTRSASAATPSSLLEQALLDFERALGGGE